MIDRRSSPTARHTRYSTKEATMQMLRISDRSSAAQPAAFSLRSLAAIALLAIACGTSSQAWCKSGESLWVADTGNNRIVELAPNDLKHSGSPTPVTIDSLNSAQGLAFDKSKNLWLEAFDNFALEFTAAQLKNLGTDPDPAPAKEFGSGADAARGCIFDKKGALWFIDAQDAVDEFTPAQLTASGNPSSPAVRVSSDASLDGPEFGVFDKSDNLWISSEDNSEVEEFTASQLGSSGDKTPAVILSANSGSLDSPEQLAFDHKGNLWVANAGNATVVMFAKKQLKASGMPVPAVTLSSSAFDEPTGLAFDGSGNLWVSNLTGGQISKFTSKQLRKSGSPTPKIAITGVLGESHQMTFGPVF
jgi:sugar lactone lactonase YvrE